MKIIKYGTPEQVLNVICDCCGCEFELYDQEIWQSCGQEEIKVTCPCCGNWQPESRDKVQVVDSCIGNRCVRLTCDECKWEAEND